MRYEIGKRFGKRVNNAVCICGGALINFYRWAGRDLYFSTPGSGLFPGSNQFTVIVGKNGTGKSRLLRSVARSALETLVSDSDFELDYRSEKERPHAQIVEPPRKVICVSTSPFDKFPTLRRGVRERAYSYLGLRGLPSHNLGLAYLSRIMSALLLNVSEVPSNAGAVARVLEYLNYAPTFEVDFSLGIPPSVFEQILGDRMSAPRPVEVVNRRVARGRISDGGFAAKRFDEASPAELAAVADSFRFLSQFGRGRVRIQFRDGRLHAHPDQDLLRHTLALLHVGLVRLRGATITKNGEQFRIQDASSGEQSAVLGLLGIASQIEDFSLVCLDEPEVCLHPQWQERYIHLLIDLFGGYRGCQFLIATHSPQVVAELHQSNCYVLSMEDGVTRSARDFSGRSVDFQLASVFRAPGRRNEYLARIALNLLSDVGRNKCFAREQLAQLQFLIDLRDCLDEGDAVRELIFALEELAAIYA